MPPVLNSPSVPSPSPADWGWNQRMNAACRNGDSLGVKQLLDELDKHPEQGDPNVAWDAPNATDPGTPLNVAIAHDRSTIVLLLAKHPRVDVNVPDAYGVAPLLNAVVMSEDPGRRGADGLPLPGVVDVVTALLDAGARPPDPMTTPYALPMGLGHTLSLADRTCHDGGHSAPAILDLLVERGWLDPTPDALRRLLVLTIGRTMTIVSDDLNLSLPPFEGTLAWLLDRHAPTDHVNPSSGHGVIEVAQGWRARAPHAFARLEQAVLHAEPTITDAPRARSRL